MNKIKSLFLLVASLISFQLQAQRTIQGIVMDSSKNALIGATLKIKGTATGVVTDKNGKFTLKLSKNDSTLVVSNIGCITQEVIVPATMKFVTITLKPAAKQVSEFVVSAMGIKREEKSLGYSVSTITSEQIAQSGNQNFASALYGKTAGVKITSAPNGATSAANIQIRGVATNAWYANTQENESYSAIKENDFQLVNDQPLSTFSIDVDRAAYSNVRRYLNNGSLPPADAVRIEEMINYFDYHYKNPTDKDPVAIYSDMATCPWDSSLQLVRIAIKGKDIPQDQLPAANLVFLIDVSGSMSDYNKLPLIQQALRALVQQRCGTKTK